MTETKLRLLHKLALDAAERARACEVKMQKNAGPAKVGDIFVFPGVDMDIMVFLALINQHPDDPDLFYVLPLDDTTLFVGACDVDEESEYLGAMVLRCGIGLWMHRDDIPIKEDEGRPVLHENTIKQCRWVLHHLATGATGSRLCPDREQLATDLDPYYQDHLDAVARYVSQVQKVIE